MTRELLAELIADMSEEELIKTYDLLLFLQSQREENLLPHLSDHE